MFTKKQLRPIKIQQRKVFPKTLCALYDAKITEKLIPLLKPFEKIGVFLSLVDEINTQAIIEWCDHNNKQCCVPIVSQRDLYFCQYDRNMPTQHNCFNILEPIDKLRCYPQVLLIPMVAFNKQGYRIGWGKGYYDRYLTTHNVYRIGVAYEWMLEAFFSNEWDQKCDLIVTQEKIHHF